MAQEATGGGHSRLTLSDELGKLNPWKVYESSQIAKYQIREGLWMLMSQSLHEEVWVKDHRLAGLFMAVKHTALCFPVKEKHSVSRFIHRRNIKL